MKPREFEEWKNIPCTVDTRDEHMEILWNIAREGMIPADQAIKVPPVEEWPEWATEIKFSYMGSNGLSRKFISTIPRPVPAVPKWTPKVGDRVFAMTSFDFLGIVGIEIIIPALSGGPDTFFVRLSTGDESSISPYGIGYLKPFDASKIGLPWSEI